jgi:hypothetical protein
MIGATVDVEPWASGGQFGSDAEVASKCRRGVIGLWKHGPVVFGSENPKARKKRRAEGEGVSHRLPRTQKWKKPRL